MPVGTWDATDKEQNIWYERRSMELKPDWIENYKVIFCELVRVSEWLIFKRTINYSLTGCHVIYFFISSEVFDGIFSLVSVDCWLLSEGSS